MPPYSHFVRDICWLQVSTHSRSGKMHPEVTCIHCQKIWFSNACIRVVEHLKDCKELPHHLWKKYQLSSLEKSVDELNASSSKKCKQSSSWMDKMKNSEAELLDELLAEFFYGAGIALSLISSLFI
jgi:hypothetical protein